MVDEENNKNKNEEFKVASERELNPKIVKLASAGKERKTIGEILLESSIVTKEQIEEALAKQKEEGGLRQKLGQILVESNVVSEDELLKALALQLDLPFYHKLPFNEVDPSLVKDVPIQFCRDNQVLPIAKDEFNVTVAVGDPLNLFPLDDLRLILSTNINMVVSPPSLILQAFSRS